MSTVDRLSLSTLTPLHWLAIGLVIVTGVVHLVLGVRLVPNAFGLSLLLAAGGFFGALVLFLLDYRRRLLYLVGIPYTGIQIVLWVAFVQPTGVSDVTPFAGIDKTAQALLIVALIALYRRDS